MAVSSYLVICEWLCKNDFSKTSDLVVPTIRANGVYDEGKGFNASCFVRFA